MKGIGTEREEEADSLSQMATIARAEPEQSQEPGTSASVLCGWQGLQDLAIFHCFSRCICRELNLKLGSQYSNQCPFGLLALQTEA